MTDDNSHLDAQKQLFMARVQLNRDLHGFSMFSILQSGRICAYTLQREVGENNYLDACAYIEIDINESADHFMIASQIIYHDWVV